MFCNRFCFLISLVSVALGACAQVVEESADVAETRATLDGDALSYLVVYKSSFGVPSTAAADIARAGGTFVAAYPFGVAVAKSVSSTLQIVGSR